jgi:flavin reductase (DIM6/NTAB) family NADH-FMN oxidoreductase RutF
MSVQAEATAVSSPIDPETFRLGMRRLAAAVSLITTELADGTRRGMTATAVCSVSVHPPTLLCCINRSNFSYEAIRRSGVFAVNVLSLDDRLLADTFARSVPPEEKFSLGVWRRVVTGAPVLESAVASFDCRVRQDVTVGTHGILFGEIHAAAVRGGAAKPLLYGHGAYGAFAVSGESGEPQSLWMPTWDYEPT